MILTAMWVLFLLTSGQGAAPAPVYLSAGEAESRLIDRPVPVHPELAQRARVYEVVILEISVSETGSVTGFRLISGHPLLNDAAVRVVRASRYEPYAPKGKAIPFTTEVRIIFMPGISEKDYRYDLKTSRPYFEQEIRCQELLKASRWQEAGEICTANLVLADQMGKNRVYEKMNAYRMAGLAMLGQEKHSEALKYLKRASGIGKDILYDDDPGIGEVLVALGTTHMKMGKPGDARKCFKQATKAFQAICDDRNMFLKARYLPWLKESLQRQIEAAEADGAAKEAVELKQRLATLQ